jgi:DNA-binding IclR family transcriptional regulator
MEILVPLSAQPKPVGRPRGRKSTENAAAPERGRPANGGIEPYFGAANSTAERAIDILLLFNDDKPFWTASEIAAHFGMPKSTVYRYVNSLRSYALIDEDGQGSFRLGARIFPLARTAKAGLPIARVAMPYLKEVSERFGEMIVLQQRIGYEIFPLERLQAPQRVTLASTRSHLLPWPATSSAKTLLAFAEPEEQEELLRMLHPTVYTSKTLQSKAALRVALEQIRRIGHATTDEERDEGVWGVSAPVFERGRAVYAIAVAAPKFRISAQKAKAITESVVAAGAAITQGLKDIDF